MEILLFMCSLFLMALVLVQRGKGGGLTGALGGMGGQSAFGSKAGDAFTKNHNRHCGDLDLSLHDDDRVV